MMSSSWVERVVEAMQRINDTAKCPNCGHELEEGKETTIFIKFNDASDIRCEFCADSFPEEEKPIGLRGRLTPA